LNITIFYEAYLNVRSVRRYRAAKYKQNFLLFIVNNYYQVCLNIIYQDFQRREGYTTWMSRTTFFVHAFCFTVKTKVYNPELNDSTYAEEFPLRPVQRVNSQKVSVNYASCVLFRPFCENSASFRVEGKERCVGGIVQPRNSRFCF